MDEVVIFSATFRHDPAMGNAIPASQIEEHPGIPGGVIVHPLIGYYAASYLNKTYFGFIKYEAPQIQWRKKPPKEASFSTTKVGTLSCSKCGFNGYYPYWGDSQKTHCPRCWQTGVNITPLKEESPEFFNLMGNIKDELEYEIGNYAESQPFDFPPLLLLGNIPQSNRVTPVSLRLASLATAKGLTLVDARDVGFDILQSDYMTGPNTGLLIEPGIFTGVLDPKAVRNGVTLKSGIVSSFIKLPFLPQPVKMYGGATL
jgi:hypothetical protein